MSEENIEVVRRLYPRSVDLVATISDPGKFEQTRVALESIMHRDFETVTVRGQVPLAGDVEMPEDSSRPVTYGLDGFASGFREWLSAWEAWVVSPTDFIDVDENRVLVLIEIQARSKTHKVEMPVQGANLCTMRNRKIARLELFFDRAEAFEAAGLRE
ncbi:MAG: hypothetical protein K0R20_2507 [Actinomycetia bacterium]|jgi:hypothetical protein|nr:hypothetical protein [Actinomycetes bacterium]